MNTKSEHRHDGVVVSNIVDHVLDGVQTKMGGALILDENVVVVSIDVDKLPGHTPRGTAIGCGGGSDSGCNCASTAASRRNNRMNWDPIRPFPPITSTNCGGCCGGACGMIIQAAVTIVVHTHLHTFYVIKYRYIISGTSSSSTLSQVAVRKKEKVLWGVLLVLTSE